MISLDRIRGAAKRSAWYDDDDDDGASPNYNPFRKTRPRIKIPDSEEAAVRTRTNKSETFAPPSMELQRRSATLEDLEGLSPKHANTMPHLSKKAEGKQIEEKQLDEKYLEATPTCVRDMAFEHDRKEKSQDSGTTITDTSEKTAVPSEPQSEPQSEATLPDDGHPRRRKRKFPFCGKDQNKDEEEESKKLRSSSSLFVRDKQNFTAVGQLKATLLNSYINVLLIMVPVGIAVNYTSCPRVGVFIINFIAIIPLAAMLSYATEEIALRTGETIGGLLNATFG